MFSGFQNQFYDVGHPVVFVNVNILYNFDNNFMGGGVGVTSIETCTTICDKKITEKECFSQTGALLEYHI